MKKLIEVALPLEAISAASSREKSIRHGHPSTLHLWWSRKPLAAARAVIWSSLVDDPSAHPELFPTLEDQNEERQRLFKLLEDLIIWEKSNDENVLAAAREEIHRSLGDNLPEFLDPFAGGGTIPLEAQRLGLKAHAHDLNPVAVMINKAMIEIPPKFAGKAPINPVSKSQKIKQSLYQGSAGLAEDVAYYGQWMKDEAFQRIGHLYPKAILPNGEEATVIAWKWARTVKCPNPACGCQMPLVNSWELSKKKGKEAYIEPKFIDDHFEYMVQHGTCKSEGTVGRSGAVCLHCGVPVPLDYVRKEGQNGRMSQHLIAIIAEGNEGRIYLSVDDIQNKASICDIPDNFPLGKIGDDRRSMRTPLYGLINFSDLFTPRQLTALTTFSDLVTEAYHKVMADGGNEEYAKAVATYLAFVVDKLSDYHSSICSWHSSGEKMRNTFGRQAIPMVWDFAESNPFCHSSGCYDNMLEWVYKCIQEFPCVHVSEAKHSDAQQDCGLRNIMISTDPPYYDNISYADLSDYFYVWMRRSLKPLYPEVFRTMLVPKAEELVATPYRFDGSKEKACAFFEDGMFETCKNLYQYSRDDIPVTIYYAYKQSDTTTKNGKKATASTGWETMLSAIIRAGFQITGTWPLNTERAGRCVAQDTNALASSIVLVCRKRDVDAPACSMREFQKTLSKELRPALEKMQSSSIAPVDLAQSAIGPGMAVYSRYSAVLRSDGTPVTIREALEMINQEIDIVFNAQDQRFDAETRFCLTVFEQYAFNDMKFGDANTLANAKNTSVERVASLGALQAGKGTVYLYPLEELPPFAPAFSDCVWTLTHHLVKTIMNDGIQGCVSFLDHQQIRVNLAHCKELSYRLYTVCERTKRANLAIGYNALVTSWDDIMRKWNARKAQGKQGQLEW